MIKHLKAYIFALVVAGSPLFAQGEATALFLLINPSPESNSIGKAGTALPTTDSYGFYLNPAQLGYASRTNVISGQTYPVKTKWLPNFNFTSITYNGTALTLGYKFDMQTRILPRSLGFGFMKGTLDYGENNQTDAFGNLIGTFDSQESFDAFAIGAGWDFYVNLNLGITYKIITPRLSPVLVGAERSESEVKENAFDFGGLLIVPVLRFFNTIDSERMTPTPKLFGFLNASIGYAKTNIGGKVTFVDIDQQDPLPRQAQLGYSLSTGFDIRYKFIRINAITIDWSVDAVDLLVNRDGSYRGGLTGDIDIGNNLILAKGDEKVDVHKGARFQLLETLQIGVGKFQGPGFPSGPKTWGFGVKLNGILKFATAGSFSRLSNILRDHIDVRYTRAKYNTEVEHPLAGTTYQSLGLFITGI